MRSQTSQLRGPQDVGRSLEVLARISGKLSSVLVETGDSSRSSQALTEASAAHATLARTVLRAAADALDGRRKFNPNFATQPRVPRGRPDGGQWTGDDGGNADGLLQPASYVRVQARASNSADDGRGTWRDPWPQSPVPAEFRNALAERESRGHPNHGYSARIIDPQGRPVLGRYQLARGAQLQIGLIDADGNWRASNPYAASERQFLNDPRAQERALDAYLRDNERQLRDFRAHEFLGREFIGTRGMRITITESGLAAAAHRYGATGVMEYLRDLEGRNAGTNAWQSYRGLGDLTIGKYNVIETRLREFQRVRYVRLRRSNR